MSSTYVNDLRLSEIDSGTESGSWGDITNTNLKLIGDALGYATQESFSSDANATTTVADGAADPARAMYLKVTSGVDLTAQRDLTIEPNTISRVMFVENATSGSQSIRVKQGSGSLVTIGSGNTSLIYLDGGGSGANAVAIAINLDTNVEGNLNKANQPKHIYSSVQAIGNSSGATIALDWDNGNMATITNNGNPSSISTPTNPVTGGNYALLIKSASGATSSWSWPSNFKWRDNTAPTLTTTTNYSNVVTLLYDGTNYLASYTTGHPS